MSKLHYCENGTSVTEQVVRFRETRKCEDYMPIQLYYNDYKDQWFNQVGDYMDRQTFEGEFDFKLIRAVDTFNDKESKRLATKNGWSDVGRFNRWFFRILTNWKSNVKNSSFRLKKRPSVQCPVCGRRVARIDANHLQHYKTLKDLPKFFVWKGNIYELSVLPRVYVITWGKKTKDKWEALHSREYKRFSSEKRRARWPWRLRNGQRGAMCPFTKKIVMEINDEYIRSLPDKHNRYADPIEWERFIEHYPSSLIQSEVYSLDYHSSDQDEDVYLRDYIAKDYRSLYFSSSSMDYAKICRGEISTEYEFAFYTIDSIIPDEVDRIVLKLIAIGYSIEDISGTLQMDKKDVRRRIRLVRDSRQDLKLVLSE